MGFSVFFKQVGYLALVFRAGELVDDRRGRVEVLEFGFYPVVIQRFYFQGAFDVFCIVVLSLNNKVVINAANLAIRQFFIFGKEGF